MSTKVEPVVAITGGARGIGRATAAAFAATGALVVIGDIDADLAKQTAAEGLGPRITGLPLDVTDTASFTRFLDAAEEAGRLRVVVNNAGIMTTGDFLAEPDETTDRMVDVNLRGVLIGSRLAAGQFTALGRGHIINVASMAGSAGFPGLVTYCATKFGVVGLSEALRAELHGTGVRVTAVRPAVVRTELSAGLAVPRLLAPIASVEPTDVARAIVSAVATGREDVWVPELLGGALRVMSMLPRPVRDSLGRVLGLGRLALDTDPVVRAAYDRRYAP